MRLLIVTRESLADRRYGLGKSIEPVREALERHGVPCRYLAQADAGARGWRQLRRLHRLAAPVLRPVFRGTDVDSLLWGLLERLNMGRLAARVATREGFTHVHCHDPLIAIGFRWAAPLSSRRRLRWGVTEHGFGSYVQALHEDGARLGGHVMRWLRARERRILMAADWVLAPTRMGLEQLVRDLGIPSPPAHWHAIPHPLPALPDISRDAARERLGWDRDSRVVLAVGRLAPLKRFAMVVRAFAAVAGPDTRLCILGEGNPGEIQRAAEQAGIAERVQVATTDDVWPWYAAADVFVSASATESFGLANLEALAAGLPVVCTSVGGVPEVVGVAAALVPSGDERALACMLGYLLEDPEVRARLSALGRARGADWPGVDRVAQAYLAVYRGDAPERLTPLSSTPVAPGVSDAPGLFRAPHPLEIPARGRVLVIAPHADDESLGCGGTLATLAAQGLEVLVVVVTDGRLGDPEHRVDGDVVAIRQQEARAAAQVLGIGPPEFLGFPDGALERDAGLEHALASAVRRCDPDWIFTPTPDDAHRDHVVTARTVRAIWDRELPRTRLFWYETWAPIHGNRIVDITETLATKLAALNRYELPLRYCDYTGAAEGLARYRGMLLDRTAGAAEVFHEVLRPGDLAGREGGG